MKLGDFIQTETEEVFRINAVAPLLLVQALVHLLQKSPNISYIVNVHAREGLFGGSKK